MIHYFVQDGNRTLSWICGAHFGTTNKEYLEVFIIVQNLVRITAVTLRLRKFNILQVWLVNAYSHPQNGGVLEAFNPQNGMQYKRDTKRHFLTR